MTMDTSRLIADIETLDVVWRRVAGAGRLGSRTRDVSHWVSALGSLEGHQRRIAAAGGWASGPSTLLGVLELDRAEVANCRALRWLLDPISRHALGTRVLGDLAAHLGLETPSPERARIRIEVSRPASRADIVIDGQVDRQAILGKLGELERIARRNGQAIGVGAAFDETIAAVAEWRNEAVARGIEFVGVSALANENRP